MQKETVMSTMERWIVCSNPPAVHCHVHSGGKRPSFGNDHSYVVPLVNMANAGVHKLLLMGNSRCANIASANIRFFVGYKS